MLFYIPIFYVLTFFQINVFWQIKNGYGYFSFFVCFVFDLFIVVVYPQLSVRQATGELQLGVIPEVNIREY